MDKILRNTKLRKLIRLFWSPKKINLGDRNSRFYKWGWETLDVTNADHIINVRNNTLPLKNSSCAVVLSSHMIEHIADETVAKLFAEVHRSLKDGGCFRIICPDMDLVLDAYHNGNSDFFMQNPSTVKFLETAVDNGVSKEHLELHNQVVRLFASYASDGLGPLVDKELFDRQLDELDKYDFADWCRSLLDDDQFSSRDWGHINAFDFTKLYKMLNDAGFKKVNRSKSMDSELPELKSEVFDKVSRRWVSLYVEAFK